MSEVNKDLRKELYDLRMQLQLAKMERKENNEKVVEIENKIKDVRKLISKDLMNQKEQEKNGKRV